MRRSPTGRPIPHLQAPQEPPAKASWLSMRRSRPSRSKRRSRAGASSSCCLVAAIVGVVVSLATWCLLELVNQIQRGVYVHLPSDLGYHHGPPLWWSLPVLALAGLIIAFAIERLPGDGGHIPANGLSTGGGPTAAGRPARGHPRGTRDDRARTGAGPRGPADRPGLRPGRPDDPPGAQGRATAGGDRARRGRHLRRGVVPVPVAVDRRGDHDRGDRSRWPEADARAAPGPTGRRHRLARLDRHGLVDRAEHERLCAGLDRRARQVRPPRHRRLRLDDRAGARRRIGVRAHG